MAAYPVAADLDYEIVADIVDSVDDLVAALDDDKVDYYCIDWGLDLDVVIDFDVFHLQVQKKRLRRKWKLSLEEWACRVAV